MLSKDITLNSSRHRLYREHKYIIHVFTDLLRLASTVDLREYLSKLKTDWENLTSLLESHAEHEENRIHAILKKHHSPLFKQAEDQHREQEIYFKKINTLINKLETVNPEQIDFLSYELYLAIRNFFSENLIHFDYEERIIMPELQRLASDQELREIDKASYKEMTSDDMVHMMTALFPHMNCEDKFTFLKDIKDCEPEKFVSTWSGITSLIENNERDKLINLLNIATTHD